MPETEMVQKRQSITTVVLLRIDDKRIGLAGFYYQGYHCDRAICHYY